MEKTFIAKNEHGIEIQVDEKTANILKGKINIIGEIKDVKYRKGDTVLTPEEFRKQHISGGGKEPRKITPGFKVEYEVDKNSKPGQFRDRTFIGKDGRETPRGGQYGR